MAVPRLIPVEFPNFSEEEIMRALGSNLGGKSAPLARFDELLDITQTRCGRLWSKHRPNAEPPSRDTIASTLQTFRDRTRNFISANKRTAYLHALFNSLHPTFYVFNSGWWAQLDEQGIRLPRMAEDDRPAEPLLAFTSPLFWIESV